MAIAAAVAEVSEAEALKAEASAEEVSAEADSPAEEAEPAAEEAPGAGKLNVWKTREIAYPNGNLDTFFITCELQFCFKTLFYIIFVIKYRKFKWKGLV